MAEATQTTDTRAPIGHKNIKVGEVLSTKMAKTIVVEVTRRVPHPMYKRIVTKRKKFYAHDEESSAKPGDIVKIVECRPLSKLKRWNLSEVVRRAVQVVVDAASLPDVAASTAGGRSAKSGTSTKPKRNAAGSNPARKK